MSYRIQSIIDLCVHMDCITEYAVKFLSTYSRKSFCPPNDKVLVRGSSIFLSVSASAKGLMSLNGVLAHFSNILDGFLNYHSC